MLLLSFPLLNGQGDLKGVVLDAVTRQPIPFAHVAIVHGSNQIRGDYADFDGKYYFGGLDPGSYQIIFNAGGYYSGGEAITISSGQVRILDKSLTPSIIPMDEFKVRADPDIIQIGNPVINTKVNGEIIMKTPYTDLTTILLNFPGAFGQDNEPTNIRGSRTGMTVFLDGMKIRGFKPTLPRNIVEELMLILGAVPPEYGDATGGIVKITTKTIPQKYFGSVEVRTSQFLDKWGHHYFNLQFGGPVFRPKRDSIGQRALFPRLSFLVTVEGGYEKDPKPTAGGSLRVKESVMQRLIQEPLQLAPAGQTGTRRSAEYLRADDFEKIDARQNVDAMYINSFGKLDFLVSDKTRIMAGGMVNLRRSREPNYSNMLFNWDNNARTDEVNYSLYGRVTHNFLPSGKAKGLLKEAKVSLQTDYVRGFGKTSDVEHEDRFFNYGYVGKFTTYRRPTYQFGYDPREGKQGFLFTGFEDTLVVFSPGSLNPMSAITTSQYYTFFNSTAGNYDNFANLQNRGAIINGQQPVSVYNLWNSIGTRNNNYSIADNGQFRAMLTGSAVIKDHRLQMGFEFEQRKDRGYSIAPVTLWTLARQHTNFHLGTIDTSKPTAVYNQFGVYADTINYPFLYVADPNRPGFGLGQSYFDWNLRNTLGLNPAGLNWIDVDDLDPTLLQLEMFSADELLNQGNSLVRYYGYDVYGNRADGGTFEDFFLKTDKHGNKTRPIAPFEPIYLAGYVMDRFSFRDIHFSVGVRLDYFDANQKMLKDKYSLYQTRTVGDAPGNHPDNAQEDWVIYVNDKNNPTEILGYRDGETWYNSEGQVINDPALLRTSSGRVQPMLADPASDVLTNPNAGLFNGFTDYKPQLNVLPRIAFAFNIGDLTQFTAHYDMLTQRPSDAVRNRPLDYFFWDNSTYNTAGTFFNNPSLRPERTTDFSVGFQQALNSDKNVAIKINAFYREMRDYIALVKVNEAYPRSYGSWENIDFGTVKGMSIEFLMSKRNFTLNASYTLQFADNTGSSNTSALNLVNSGQPNLRTTIPTNFDRRHMFTGLFTFDFGSSGSRDINGNSGYIGPNNRFLKAICENLGFTMTLRGGSGVPYSRQSNVISTQLGGGQASLQGTINGARLPWEFNSDLMVYKNIKLSFGKKEDKHEGSKNEKSADLQIYLMAENLFDFRNTISVYSATGSSTDDGYLSAPQYQPFIEGQVDPQSFRDLYAMKVNNPQNYTMPRRMRIGAILSF